MKTYEFTLIAPGNKTQGTDGSSEMERKVASAIGTASKALKALGVLGSGSRRLEWEIEARADLSGVDIAKSKKVHVNTI